MTNAKQPRRRTPLSDHADAARDLVQRTVRTTRPISLEKAREQLERKGLTIRDWAKAHNVPYHTAKKVLAGRNKGHYGEAHRVAVLLKIKAGTAIVG